MSDAPLAGTRAGAPVRSGEPLSPTNGTAHPRRPGRDRLVAAAVLVLLAVLLDERVWITREGTVVGTGLDPDLFIWYMRWTPWAIAHGQDPLLTHQILAPDGANLMWNTSVILPALVLWPVTALVGPQWSYDILLTMAPALSGWVAFIALRRHASWLAALAGAVLYGFSPMMLTEAQGHPMVTVAVFPPLALVLIENILGATSRRRRLVDGALLGVASACQLLVGTEILAITVIVAVIGIAVLALLHRDVVGRQVRGLAEGLAAAAVGGAALGAFPLAILLAGPQHVSAALQVPDIYVQDAAALVVPGPGQLLAPQAALDITGPGAAHPVITTGYVGLPLLAVIVACALLLRRRREVRWAVVTAAAAVLLALGPHLHVAGRLLRVPLPWRLAVDRPLVESLIPARFMVVAFLPLALLVALGVDAVLARRSARWNAVAALAAAAIAASVWPHAIGAQTPVTQVFFTSGAAQIPSDSTVLVSPLTSDYSAMRDQAAADMRFRITAGGAFVPGPRFGPPSSPLDDALRAAESDPAWVLPSPPELAAEHADLRSQHLSAVVVAPQPQQARVVALMTAILGSAPREVEGVQLWTLPNGS